MPRIDSENLKAGFKKKEYRAWDNNLLERLKIPKEKRDDESATTQSAQKPVPTQEIKNIEENQPVDLGFNQGSIGVQSGFNQGSDTVQLESVQGSNKVQSEFNQGSIGVPKEEGNRVQLGFNEAASSIDSSIKKLGGNEQKIFFYIIEICIAKGSLSTGEMPGKTIMSAVGTNKNGMETALKRLRKKGLISREKGKTGKNGLICLTLSEAIKNAAIKYMHTYQSEQALFNQGSIRVQAQQGNRVQIGFNNPIYSSNNKKNITTALPDDWKKINYSPLESIGFTEQHLLDVFAANIFDASVVQESIYHFAFGLEEGRHKQYDDPLKVFIGRLRKGNAWIESNYESPKDKALRVLFERKKAEKEKRDAMINELIEIEFPDWRKKLTPDEIKQIVPAETLKVNLAPAITAALRTHYVDNVLLQKLSNDNLRNDGGFNMDNE